MNFFFALLIKHAIVDLGIQSHLNDIDKNRYISNAHIHYLHHGISTFLIALFFTSPQLAILCAIIDYVAHWHIDFVKHNVTTIFNIEGKSLVWWWISAADAALHFLTYYVIILLISYSV